jgi:lipopolysaccharide export system protein LptA
MKRLYCLFLLMLCITFHIGARAEKADADQPTNVEANQMAYDDIKQINTFSGNVVLTRGTLIMKAEKMIVTQSPEGYQFATLYAAPGRPASFRQKRDGGANLWIEGQAADRIEYDGKIEVARLFSKAKITLLDGTKPTDEVEGEFISYDSRAEFYSVSNAPTGNSKPGPGRIRATIQPRKEAKGN